MQRGRLLKVNFRSATQDDVARAEAEVDRRFGQGLVLPGEDRATILRYLLAVAEDAQRLPLLRFPENRIEVVQSWCVTCDDMKYVLKEVLPHAVAAPVASFEPIARFDSDMYGRAANALEWCEQYQSVRCAFGSFYGKGADCRVEAGGLALKFSVDPIRERFDAFDALLNVAGEDSASSALQSYLIGRSPLPEPMVEIAAATTADSDWTIGYEFDGSRARALQELVPELSGVLPHTFSANGWAGGEDILRVFRALNTVALYHLVAVFFGTALHKTHQLGVASAVLEIDRDELVERVTTLSGVDVRHVRRLLSSMEYGAGVESPDPALQPLVPLGDGRRLLLSPMLTLTSNLPRNFLSLLQRIDGPAFHAASHVFETKMVERIEGPLRGRRWVLRSRWNPAWLPPTVGEIDLVVADPDSRTVAVVELRWMNPAGDTRDVLSKYEAVSKKGAQARRKCEALELEGERLKAELGVAAPGRWRFVPVVMTAGFAGPCEGVLSVREEVWGGAVSDHSSLRAFLQSLEEDRWLAKRRRDYERVPVTTTWGDLTIEWTSIAPLPGGILRALQLRRWVA